MGARANSPVHAADESGAGFPSGFGESLAIDGNVIAAGVQAAYQHDGVVYVFEPNAEGVWVAQVLENPDRQINELAGLDTDFAIDVDVSGDWLVIGSSGTMFTDNTQGVLSGAAYMYRRTAQGWTFQQRIIAPIGADNDFFGEAVALDGHRVLIGAPRMVDIDDPDNTYAAGAAYIYERQANGIWTFVHAFREDPLVVQGYFGASVELDGGHAIMTASGANNVANRVWASTLDNSGQWSALTEITPPADDNTVGARFGETIVIDGETAFLGSPGRPQNWSRVYRMVWANGAWQHDQVLEQDLEDALGNDEFGAALAYHDGTLVIGAPYDSGPAQENIADTFGAAYVFTNAPPICTMDGACVCLDEGQTVARHQRHAMITNSTGSNPTWIVAGLIASNVDLMLPVGSIPTVSAGGANLDGVLSGQPAMTTSKMPTKPTLIAAVRPVRPVPRIRGAQTPTIATRASAPMAGVRLVYARPTNTSTAANVSPAPPARRTKAAMTGWAQYILRRHRLCRR